MRRVLRNIGDWSQQGNAALISLIVMSSAMTVSLGTVTVVVGEVKNAAIMPTAEHAYYKAESYIEQALWEKKRDPNYNIDSLAALNSSVTNTSSEYVCGGNVVSSSWATVNCFLTSPNDGGALLKDFLATTSRLDNNTLELKQDKTQQLDIDTAVSASATGTLQVNYTTPVPATSEGLEVSIIAYSKTGNLTNVYPNPAANTNPLPSVSTVPSSPVFVDKKIFGRDGAWRTTTGASTGSNQLTIGQGQKNALDESYPPLNNYVYRLRFRSLRADVSAQVNVTGGGVTYPLRSPDFTVRAVAEDSSSRRGIEVVVPAQQEIVNVFDFVIFSDLKLEKLEAKKPATTISRSITARAYRLPNESVCTNNISGATPMNNVPMNLSTVGTQFTGQGGNPAGSFTFNDLTLDLTYTLTAQGFDAANYEICNPNSATYGPITTSTNHTFTATVRPVCRNVSENRVTPPYPHYGPPYHHYTAPYAHYGPPYNHWHWHVELWEGNHGHSSYGGQHIPMAGYPYPEFYEWYVGYDGKQSLPHRYEKWHEYNHNHGYYGDYLGTYPDWLGYYGDYLGTYGDPYVYTFRFCPS